MELPATRRPATPSGLRPRSGSANRIRRRRLAPSHCHARAVRSSSRGVPRAARPASPPSGEPSRCDAPAGREPHRLPGAANDARGRPSPRARRPRPGGASISRSIRTHFWSGLRVCLASSAAPAATPGPAASRGAPSPRPQPDACARSAAAREAHRGPSRPGRTPGDVRRPPRRRPRSRRGRHARRAFDDPPGEELQKPPQRIRPASTTPAHGNRGCAGRVPLIRLPAPLPATPSSAPPGWGPSPPLASSP